MALWSWGIITRRGYYAWLSDIAVLRSWGNESNPSTLNTTLRSSFFAFDFCLLPSDSQPFCDGLVC